MPWKEMPKKKKRDGFSEAQVADIKKTFEGKMTEELSPAEVARAKVLDFFGMENTEAAARRAAIARQKAKKGGY